MPFLLALNMADEAASRGFSIDAERLARELGVDVVPTVAVQRKGLATLQARLAAARASRFEPRYDAHIEAAIAEVAPLMPKGGIGARALALMALVGDESLRAHLAGHLAEAELARVEAARRTLAARYPESLRFVVARQRLAAVDRLHDAVVTRGGGSAASGFGRRLGGWSTHPVWGLPDPRARAVGSPTSSWACSGRGRSSTSSRTPSSAGGWCRGRSASCAGPCRGRGGALPRRARRACPPSITAASSSGSTAWSRWGSPTASPSSSPSSPRSSSRSASSRTRATCRASR